MDLLQGDKKHMFEMCSTSQFYPHSVVVFFYCFSIWLHFYEGEQCAEWKHLGTFICVVDFYYLVGLLLLLLFLLFLFFFFLHLCVFSVMSAHSLSFFASSVILHTYIGLFSFSIAQELMLAVGCGWPV